jgi:hypothetical protein
LRNLCTSTSVRMLSTLAVFSLMASQGVHAGPSGTGNGNNRIQVKCDVVVVGGGAAGANSAVFAKDKGYRKVCIIESRPDLGGHCDTIDLDPATVPASCPYNLMFGGRCPTWSDVGVQVYQNTSLLQEMGFGSYAFDFTAHLQRFAGANNVFSGSYSQFGPSSQVYADFQHGFPVQLPDPTPQQAAAFQQAVGTLIGITYAYPWLDDAGNFPNPIPAELLVDWKTFVNANGMQALWGPFMQVAVGTGGYGSYDKLPTLYALLALRRGILNLFGFVNPTKPSGVFLWGGCKKLYEGILPFVGEGNVYFNSQIDQIVRKSAEDDDNSDDADDGGRPIRVRFTSNGLRYRIKAKKLVVAIPPTTNNMQILVDQSAEEKALFSKVQLRYIATALFKQGQGDGPILNSLRAYNQKLTLVNLDVFKPDLTPDVPHVNDLQNSWPYSFLFSHYVTQAPVPITSAIQGVSATLPLIPALYATPQLNFVIPHSQYQPYFAPQDLAVSPTPYQRFAALQGKADTIFVGATYSFSETSKILEHAFKTVRDQL